MFLYSSISIEFNPSKYCQIIWIVVKVVLFNNFINFHTFALNFVQSFLFFLPPSFITMFKWRSERNRNQFCYIFICASQNWDLIIMWWFCIDKTNKTINDVWELTLPTWILSLTIKNIFMLYIWNKTQAIPYLLTNTINKSFTILHFMDCGCLPRRTCHLEFGLM